MSQTCIVLFQNVIIFFYPVLEQKDLHLWGQKMTSCQKITSCCLYSDDMAILSLSSEGFQNCLNRIYMYCNKWKIEVSTVKTKILIFNTSGKLMKGYRFHYNGKILEQVRDFKYSGTTFSATGNVSCAKEKPKIF